MVERTPPHRWVIEGAAERGGSATLTYRLTPRDRGTRFERELVYRMPNLWLAIMDAVVIRRRMTAQSAEALQRLNGVLERDGASTSP